MDRTPLQVAGVEVPSRVGPLFVKTWRREGLASGPAVLIVPGFAMHGDPYAPLAVALAERGAIVAALDLPGNGRTGGKLTLRAAQRAILAAMDYVEALAGSRAAVVGVSAGGAYVLSLGRSANRARRIALIAPGLLVQPGQVFSWRAVSDFWMVAKGGGLGTLGWRLETASTNPAFLADRRADPLGQPTVSASYLAAVVAAAITAGLRSARVTRPTAIWHGTADHLVAPLGSRLLARRLGTRHLHMVDGGDHGLIWDRAAGPRVIAEVAQWVLGRATRPAEAKVPLSTT